MSQSLRKLTTNNKITAMKAVIFALLLAATLGKESPPNVDDVAYGVNILLGMPPAEQRSAAHGGKLFLLTGDKADVSGWIHHDQFSDFSESSSCEYSESSEEIHYVTSSSTLESQSKSSSQGYDQTTTYGVSVPVKGAEVSAETETRNALMFGNSQSSVKASNQQENGYEYSFNSYAQRQLYIVEVDYDNLNSWTEDFKNKCKALGEDPSWNQLLEFFDKYGTHGMKKASFGQKCTSSVFMKGGTSINSYYEFNEDTSSYDAQYLWFQASGSTSVSDKTETYDEYGVDAKFADRRCEGEIATGSSCSGLMIASGKDAPSIIKWYYKPIWDMNIPTLTAGAKSQMRVLYDELVKALIDCGQTLCYGHGTCAPTQQLLDYSGNDLEEIITIYATMPTQCFCYDGFIGDRCQSTEQVNVGHPYKHSYANDWDDSMDFSDGDKPICGVWSKHSNDREDRRYRFSTCELPDENRIEETKVLPTTSYDARFSRECPSGMVMYRIESWHSNDREDRKFKFHCAKYKDTERKNKISLGDYVNDWDREFDFKCDSGSVLYKVYSKHSNDREDRQFKFGCYYLYKTKESLLSLTQEEAIMEEKSETYGYLGAQTEEIGKDGGAKTKLTQEKTDVDGELPEDNSDNEKDENQRELVMDLLQSIADEIYSTIKDLLNDVITINDVKNVVEKYDENMENVQKMVEKLPEKDAEVMGAVKKTNIKIKILNFVIIAMAESAPSEENENNTEQHLESRPFEKPKVVQMEEYALRGSHAGESQNIAPNDYEKIALTLSELGLPQDKIEKVLYELMSDNE